MPRTLLPILFLIASISASAQNGNFRSIISGVWTTPGLWERDADNDGVYEESPTTLIPSYLDGKIIIQNTHNVRVNSNISADEVSVLTGGRISVLSTGHLTIKNGTGVDLKNAGLISSAAVANLIIEDETEYEHAQNGGIIPLATWHVNSFCSLTGVTTTLPANLNPAGGFGNFTWNCPNQAANLNFANQLTNVKGAFTISETKGFRIFLTTTTGTTFNVGGNFIISGNSRVLFTSTSNFTVNIGGKFGYYSSNATGTTLTGSSGSVVLNVSGDFEINSPGSVLYLSTGTGSATINLLGNFLLNAGTMTETSTGFATFNFIRSGTQLFSNLGTIPNTVDFDYNIQATSILQTQAESPIKGRTLNVDGSIVVTSLNPTGAIVTGKSQGNIRTTTRNFNLGSQIVYAGAAAQYIGNGHPSSASVKTVINNPAGVNFTTNTMGNISSSALEIGGNLELLSGNLQIISNWNTDRTLRLSGSVQSSGNIIDFIGDNTNLEILGSGNLGVIPFTETPETMKNLYVNRTSGYVQFDNKIVVTGNLTIDNGHVLSTSLSGIDVNGNLTLTGQLSTTNLNLKGDFTNNGLFDNGTSGQIVFSGLALQRIMGTTETEFKNIVVSNNTSPVSVSIETNQKLAGSLTLSEGSQFDADGSTNTAIFTLLSLGEGPGQTGMIAALPASAAVIGAVTVQRFLASGDNINRFISSPVTNATVAQLQDDFSITGNFTGTSYPCTGCTQSGASLKYYYEPIKGDFNQGYIATPVNGGSNAELLVPGRGYSAYMWNGVSNTIVDLTGPINSGRIVLNVTHTPSVPANVSADGWNMIGNPYPSAISWDQDDGWERNNVGSTVYVWDVFGAHWRTYDYTLNEENQDLNSGLIASGQAFWVYKYPGLDEIAINENAKSSTDGQYYRKVSDIHSGIKVMLSKGSVIDQAFVLVNTQNSASLFSPKLELGIEDLSVSVTDESNKFVYYSVDDKNMPETIPLSVNAFPGEYTMTLQVMGNNASLNGYVLVDQYLHQVYKINEQFTFKITNNYLTSGNRFVITRKADEFISESPQDIFLSSYPNPITDNLNIEVRSNCVDQILLINNIGKIVVNAPFTQDFQVASANIDVRNLASGVYIVKVITKDQHILNNKVVKQ